VFAREDPAQRTAPAASLHDLIGPLLGSVADRVDRRRCAIAADVARAAALAAICLGGGFAPMLALALVAGLGGTLFGAATGALMPALVAPARLPAANGLYRALRDGGVMLGPALAAGMLLLTGPTSLLLLDAASFPASALLLTRLRPGPADTAPPEPAPSEDGRRGSLLAETGEGVRAIAALPAVPLLLVVSSAAAPGRCSCSPASACSLWPPPGGLGAPARHRAHRRFRWRREPAREPRHRPER
jgi:MFS family permease